MQTSTQTKPMKLPAIKFAKSESLVLRCCRADMTSHGGFTWKKEGIVAAPDWDEDPHCGNGLHGWLAGEGEYRAWRALPGDLWMVLAVETKTIVDLGVKVKFPKARVLYVGARETAAALITAHCPGSAVIFGTATAGDSGTATAGDSGTATAGNYGTATAGYSGTATAGYSGTATAGDRGTATAGDSGTATAGNYGTATAGNYGTATAGDRGTILLKYWDDKNSRYRLQIGYIGEKGLKPGVAYRLGKNKQFIKAKP